MSNTAYGKTMEKLRNRIDVRLVGNEKGLFKMNIRTKRKYLKMIQLQYVEVKLH